MRFTLALFATTIVATAGFAQGTAPAKPTPIGDVLGSREKLADLDASAATDYHGSWTGGGRFAGNHNFDNFIGFLSNPLQNIDPRAMTAIWPMFGSLWVSTQPALPSGDLQIYGAGLYVALSERLSFGMNQGGYAAAHFNRDPAPLADRQFRDRLGRLHDRNEFSGEREGWLNLGGFVQYTLIEDVPNQFLATIGLRWEAPSGSHDIFQGDPPWHLAPYITIGKEFGCFHVLATTGFEFPAGTSRADLNFFYADLHIDRKFGWFYPLVELNWDYHTSNVHVDLPTRHGFIDFNNFASTGNILVLAVGANAVLQPGRLEIGAAYTTPIASQRSFDYNGLLVKLLLRF